MSDTRDHVQKVQSYIDNVMHRIDTRADWHDSSKFEEPEASAFEAVSAKLSNVEYGSDEYKKSLEELREPLKHHYSHNSHHPQYYAIDSEGEVNDYAVESGFAISQMSLLDLLEMLTDWKASTERMSNGDIRKSLEVNTERFGIDEQLHNILLQTIEELAW